MLRRLSTPTTSLWWDKGLKKEAAHSEDVPLSPLMREQAPSAGLLNCPAVGSWNWAFNRNCPDLESVSLLNRSACWIRVCGKSVSWGRALTVCVCL